MIIIHYFKLILRQSIRRQVWLIFAQVKRLVPYRQRTQSSLSAPIERSVLLGAHLLDVAFVGQTCAASCRHFVSEMRPKRTGLP